LIDNPSWQHFATHERSAYPELWDGVRAYYAPCLGPSGTRLHDVSGLNNWGTLTNMDAATDWVVDGGRYALDFDGTNDRLDLASSVTFSGDFTLNIWIYPRSNNGITWTNSANGLTTVFFDLGSSRIGTRGEVSTLNYFAAPSILNAWTMITVRRQSNSFGMFFNSRPSTTSPIAGTTGNFVFNRFGISFQLILPNNCLAGEQIMSHRAMSQNEINQLYQIGRGGMLTPATVPALFAFPSNPLAIFAASHAAVIGG
jgi:hypothetical protein